MAVTIQDVAYVADLAHLTFSEEEKEVFTEQLNRILEYMEKLNELDTRAVEPMTHVLAIQNVFREDRPGPSLSQKEALATAPAQGKGHFRVPKVIG